MALAIVALAYAPGAAEPTAVAEAIDDVPAAWASLVIEASQPTQLEVTSQSADPAITAALERIAGRPPESSGYAVGWVQWTTVLPAPSRDKLVLSQSIALDPLLEALESAGQPMLALTVRHPRSGFVTLTGATIVLRQPGWLSATVATRGPRPPLVFETGWRPADVTRAASLLLIALVAPIAAGLAVRWRSIARDRAPGAWFGRAQAVNLIMLGGWMLWMVAVEATRVADLGEFASDRGPHRMITGPLWMLAFLPTGLCLTAIARNVTRRLRGFDPLPRGSVLSPRRILPLVMLLVAAGAFSSGSLRVGVFALLGAIAAMVLLPGGRGPLGMTPQALSSGALRDRLFEFARRAGVKLRELYVVPMRRERLANAFAVSGGVVMVADELLDRMSRREVDAVLAHEISHLEHHHPQKIVLAAAGAACLVGGVAMSVGAPYGAPAGLVAAWLAFLFVSRRYEFRADADAAALTGDPEAGISSLGQLARLNDMPLAWGRVSGWLITHPTTEARGLAVGRRAGLTPDRVRELLAKGIPPGERYGHAERPGEEARVYSTAWKTAVLGRLSLGLLASAVLAPAVALAISRAFGFEPPHVVAILAGFALAFAAVLFMVDQFAARPVSKLEDAVRRRCAGQRSDDGAAAFVSLSPGDAARVYEGFYGWDLGLLTIEPDRLRYRGEQVALDLPRHSVRAIEVGAATPSWIRARGVVVRWAAPGGEQVVTLSAASTTRVSAIAPAAGALAARLREWHGRGDVTGAGPAPGDAAGPVDGAFGARDAALSAPSGVGSVTSLTPAEAASLRDLPILAVLIGVITAGASFLLGLDVWFGVDVFAAALLAMLAMRVPMLTWRERSRADAADLATERRAA